MAYVCLKKCIFCWSNERNQHPLCLRLYVLVELYFSRYETPVWREIFFVCIKYISIHFNLHGIEMIKPLKLMWKFQINFILKLYSSGYSIFQVKHIYELTPTQAGQLKVLVGNVNHSDRDYLVGNAWGKMSWFCIKYEMCLMWNQMNFVLLLPPKW